MKILASFLLLSTMVFTGFALVQTNQREQIHQTIANLRSDLSKAEEEFLSVTHEDKAKYAAFLKQPDTGLIRLLPREIYDKPSELTINGGGAYYSFVTLTHAYGHGSDIQFEQNRFSVGFAGADYGFMVRVEGASLQEMTIENPVAAVMAAYQPPTAMPKIRMEQRRAGTGFEENGINLQERADAVVGSTYLLRSFVFDRSDILVCFQVVRKDSDGSVILAWKTLKKFDAPKIDRSTIETDKC